MGPGADELDLELMVCFNSEMLIGVRRSVYHSGSMCCLGMYSFAHSGNKLSGCIFLWEVQFWKCSLTICLIWLGSVMISGSGL